MKDIKNPTSLNLDIPKPKVTKISRLALISIVGMIVLLFGVALISLQHHAVNNTQDSAPDQSNEKASTDDKAWYLNKSNAVVAKQTLSTDDPLENKPAARVSAVALQLKKLKQEAYLQAINSSLVPAGVQDNQATASSTTENSSRNVSTPTTTLDPSLRQLPLDDNQIAKLASAFGEHVDPNLQSEKQQFTETIAKMHDKDYLDESVKDPVSPFELQTGSVIPASLNGGINSDLPGQLTAIVRQNVYDTVTGQYLLIPQGSKLIIIYDSNIAYGQERVLPSVKRIIFPNGQSMDLQGMPGSDISGYSGFNDQVNNHYLRIYGSAIVMGGISAAFQISQPQQTSVLVNPTNTQIAAGAMGQQLAQVATTTISKNLDVQPTLIIRPGYEFNVNITADMVFPHPYIG